MHCVPGTIGANEICFECVSHCAPCTMLRRKRYFVLRIEDLALGDPTPTLDRLAKFLGLEAITPSLLLSLKKICR